MQTKKFKTKRGWLDYVAKRGNHGSCRVYESVSEFFKSERHFFYYTKFREPCEKYHSEIVSAPWEWKYEFALAIVNFHWNRRTKSEREWIATKLAKGEGDLSMLQAFVLELRRGNGVWVYDYCTCGLSGPNYDWCKRKYFNSI